MKYFKLVFICILLCSIVISSVSCAEKACQHTYIETAVTASCTEEGYNLFTCDQCGDSYKGDKIVPKVNHIGTNNCTNCEEDLVALWKDFVYQACDGYIKKHAGTGEQTYVTTGTVVDEYDCMLCTSYTDNSDGEKWTYSLILAYNSYDKQWAWQFEVDTSISFVTLTSKGVFEKWSSHSNYIPCTYDDFDGDPVMINMVKKLYNITLDTINGMITENGYNFTLENFGLEQ